MVGLLLMGPLEKNRCQCQYSTEAFSKPHRVTSCVFTQDISWMLCKAEHVALTIPLLSLAIKLRASLSASSLLEICRVWRTDSRAPRGQLPRLSLCHLAEVPSSTVLRSVNRWRVVKAPGDQSRSKRLPFPRRRGRWKTSRTCDHLLRAAPGGRRLAKVARCRKSRGFEAVRCHWV